MIHVKEFTAAYTSYSEGELIPAMTITITGAEDVLAFKQLVAQGNSLYPNNPVAIKVAADIILHGKVLYNYEGMM
jgi:hypothetical protein